MVNHTLTQLALRNRALICAQLPTARAWTNVDFEPTPGVPYIVEEYVPATSTLRGLLAGGTTEATGLYLLHWYGMANTDLALSADVDALLALFAAGTTLPLTNGDTVRVRADSAPWRGPITNDDRGLARITVTVPWRVFTTNTIT